MEPVLEFLNNVADEDEGLSNAGIETFRDAPFAGIARECGQNSLDAAVSHPITLSFDLLNIPSEEFPALEEYKATIEACVKRARERKNKDEYKFFTNARLILKQPNIRVLRISDEGTTGLSGPCEQGTPFHALVKSAGVSQKDTLTAGGSFGIGKHAAYAVSDLRTVFYSTIYQTPEGKTKFLAQGKTILASHADSNGEKKKASGYWGSSNYLPVTDTKDVPEWMVRDSKGTSIFAAGFPDSDDWALRVIESLLRNFSVAIHRGTIRFSIDHEKYILDQNTLPELFKNEDIIKVAFDNFSHEDFINSYQLYKCLISPNTKLFQKRIKHIGGIQMHIAVQDGLPKRIYIVRNGILITDNLQYFNDRLIRFPMYKDFIAFVEPYDDNSSKAIKRLEDPKHKDLSAERIIDREERDQIKSAMRELIHWIRESIKGETFEEPEDEIELSEMSEFFADASDDPPVPDPSSEELDPERFVYKPINKNKSGTSRDETGLDGGGGTRRGKKKSKKHIGPGRGSGAGGSGHHGRGQKIEYTNFRNILSDTNPDYQRTLFFTPEYTCPARIEVEAAGINNNEKLKIKSVYERNNHDSNTEEILLQDGERISIELVLEEPFIGPIELILINNSQIDENIHED